jgi:hypothetical protein
MALATLVLPRAVRFVGAAGAPVEVVDCVVALPIFEKPELVGLPMACTR